MSVQKPLLATQMPMAVIRDAAMFTAIGLGGTGGMITADPPVEISKVSPVLQLTSLRQPPTEMPLPTAWQISLVSKM